MFANNPWRDLRFFTGTDSAGTHLSWFVKGVPAQAAELECCVRCVLPTWKGMHVLRAAFIADFSPGVSCVPFFSNGYNVLTVAPTPSALQTERCSGERQQKWPSAPLPPGVFHIAEAMAHGNVQGPRGPAVHTAVAPQRRSPGAACSGGFAYIS